MSSSKKILKVGIYDPYLDTLGGGERYCLTVAETYLQLGHKVDLFWSGPKDIIASATSRFSLNLENLSIVPDIFGLSPRYWSLLESPPTCSFPPLLSQSLSKKICRFINKIKVTGKYDIFFYLSDGSLPFIFAKKNLIHFQVPFSFTPSFKSMLASKLKLTSRHHLVYNSAFTKSFIQKLYPHRGSIVYPPVDVDKFYSSVKTKTILSVGRFDNLLNAKRQDVLIDIFKELITREPGLDWRLVLAGGSFDDPQTNSYLQLLKQKAAGLNIFFVVNPDFNQLTKLYSESSIYWHAAGYQVDTQLHPEATEHFGITTVEALASGCVPVVVNAGGLPEIVTNQENGLLWSTTQDAVIATLSLIKNPSLMSSLSNHAKIKSIDFSKTNFTKNLLSL